MLPAQQQREPHHTSEPDKNHVEPHGEHPVARELSLPDPPTWASNASPSALTPAQSLPLSQAWINHAWLRLRRMDYWNSAHISGNMPAKAYRWLAPSSNTGANLMKHDVAVGTSNFSVRYYNRDVMRRDVGYYPDTPLSTNHAIMKGHALRPPPSTEPAASLPKISYFGDQPTGKYGTPAAMGLTQIADNEQRSGVGIPVSQF